MDNKGPLIGGAIVLAGGLVALVILGLRTTEEDAPAPGQTVLVEDAAAPAPIEAPDTAPVRPAPGPDPLPRQQQQALAPAPPPPQATAPPPPAAIASIAGAWHDEEHNDYLVQQQGNQFALVSALGPAAFIAEGLVQGQNLRMQGGSVALGVAVDCTGRVIGPPQRLRFTCTTSTGDSFSAEYHRPGEG
ncbi:MAG: hypothetical protein ACK4TG_10010 [Thermaurantiacus sp.]